MSCPPFSPLPHFFVSFPSPHQSQYSKIDGKANTSHTHDDRYYTETEINGKLKQSALFYEKSIGINVYTPGGGEGSGTGSANIAVSGYVPIAIKGFTCPSAYHHLFKCDISGNTLSIGVRSTGLQEVTAVTYVRVLYFRA